VSGAWQAMFTLMFGFWAHFATQNRAFRSNLLSCASQIPLQSLAFGSRQRVYMRYALAYPKLFHKNVWSLRKFASLEWNNLPVSELTMLF
jgi:hypothetical protein